MTNETTVIQVRADMLFTPEQLRLLDLAAKERGETREALLERLLYEASHQVITQAWRKERGA